MRVALGERSYEIITSTEETDGLAKFVRSLCSGDRVLVVADVNTTQHAIKLLPSLTKAGFDVSLATLPSGEATKSISFVLQLYDRLADLPADRKTVVMAIGGGVIGDLAGFAAATYARGLPLVMVPTTLLAMVDSAVGGKVGINHARGKNLIGSFHQPRGVWIESSLLQTLPEREFRSGLAEVVKYGVILDEDFFYWIEHGQADIMNRLPSAINSMVMKCCQLKASIVEKDEREEKGLRALLNYGHTFAHAIEAVTGYGSWLHGEAVSAGMICASQLAERIVGFDARGTQRQADLLRAFGLPVRLPEVSAAELLLAMRTDKKAESGRLRFVLPRRLGHVETGVTAPDELVLEVLRQQGAL